MIESSTTAAPTTPIGAARMVPITMTATASAPGTRFSRISVASSMSLAEPERSRIDPMKMNIGIETSTGSTATPPHMRSRMLDRLANGNTPSSHPIDGEDQRRPAHHERDRIAAEDHDEHRDEHDEGEIVGEPVEHRRPSDFELGVADLQLDLALRPPAEQEHDQRAACTLTMPASSSQSPR